MDIALHYDTTDKLWDGDYVTLEADAAVAPNGNDEDTAETADTRLWHNLRIFRAQGCPNTEPMTRA
ncbi:TPA: hypothetical protein ACH3X1_015387 [Trebouxia sp. C0004]